MESDNQIRPKPLPSNHPPIPLNKKYSNPDMSLVEPKKRLIVRI